MNRLFAYNYPVLLSLVIFMSYACEQESPCLGLDCVPQIKTWLAAKRCMVPEIQVQSELTCTDLEPVLPPLVLSEQSLSVKSLFAHETWFEFPESNIELQWQILDADTIILEGTQNQIEQTGQIGQIDLSPLKNKFSQAKLVTLELTIDGACEANLSWSKEFILIDDISTQSGQTILTYLKAGPTQDELSIWGDEVIEYLSGDNLSDGFDLQESALGTPSFDQEGYSDVRLAYEQTLSLGAGGEVIIELKQSISNQMGPDLAIFENSFNGSFIEYAWIEVSSDGESFVRFPNYYFAQQALGSFDERADIQDIGLAGHSMAGQGVGFDLTQLTHYPEVRLGQVDLNQIRFVKVVDIVGDGEARDTLMSPIYDPYPTQGSAGFDLDAIGGLTEPSGLCKEK